MFRNRAHCCRAIAALSIAVISGSSVLGQEAVAVSDDSQAADRWGPLKLLEGSWSGAIKGALGTGTGNRRYEFIMDGQFLMSRHDSVRLPQEQSPQGDQHSEIGMFSYDSERETLVLREFMGEGVVVRSPCSIEGMTVVCTAEAVESGPGIRARLTLLIQDRYRFVERYEIAWAGEEDLQLYFSNEWTRVPDPDNWRKP